MQITDVVRDVFRGVGGAITYQRTGMGDEKNVTKTQSYLLLGAIVPLILNLSHNFWNKRYLFALGNTYGIGTCLWLRDCVFAKKMDEKVDQLTLLAGRYKKVIVQLEASNKIHKENNDTAAGNNKTHSEINSVQRRAVDLLHRTASDIKMTVDVVHEEVELYLSKNIAGKTNDLRDRLLLKYANHMEIKTVADRLVTLVEENPC